MLLYVRDGALSIPFGSSTMPTASEPGGALPSGSPSSRSGSLDALLPYYSKIQMF